MHLAAKDDLNGIAQLLIQNGANLNLKNEDGLTALHLASSNDKNEIVELLLKSGAKIEICCRKRRFFLPKKHCFWANFQWTFLKIN